MVYLQAFRDCRLSWVLSVCLPTYCRGVPFPRALLPSVLVASWGCSDGTGGTWFLVFILIAIPAVIRDAEPLVLWWRFGSLLFPWTLSGKLTCGSWLPGSRLCLELISAFPAPGHVLRTAVINRPQRLRNRSASKRQRWNCSYRKCPRGGSTFPGPPLVPRTTRALGQLGSLGCELERNVPAARTKGVSSHFSPLKLHPPLRTHSIRGHSTLLRGLGGCTLKKEAWTGHPSPRGPGV